MADTYSFTLGDLHCMAINDGGYAGNADMLFANAPQEQLRRALDAYGEQADAIPSAWTCLLVRSKDRMTLIDTGGGHYGGALLPGLREAGIAPEDIDDVILTHAHGDHIGGCLDGDGRPTFPNATYYISEEEWAYWTADTQPTGVSEWAYHAARATLLPLSGCLQRVAADTEISPGIRTQAAFGHTPGHLAVKLSSGPDSLLFLSDAALHPIHLRLPHWFGSVDILPQTTVATRRQLLGSVAAEGTLALFYHFLPFPSLGHVVAEAAAWRWLPVQPGQDTAIG